MSWLHKVLTLGEAGEKYTGSILSLQLFSKIKIISKIKIQKESSSPVFIHMKISSHLVSK